METVVVAIDESKFAQFALKCKYTSALYAFIVYNIFKFIKCMPFVVEISIFSPYNGTNRRSWNPIYERRGTRKHSLSTKDTQVLKNMVTISCSYYFVCSSVV